MIPRTCIKYKSIKKDIFSRLNDKNTIKIFFRNAAAKAKFANMDLTPSDLTPAMEEVIAKRAARLASGMI